MNIRLDFDCFFSGITGISGIELEVPAGSSIDRAVGIFLDRNPEIRQKFNSRKLFLTGNLRAIYLLDRTAVKGDHLLRENDHLKIMKAFIGG